MMYSNYKKFFNDMNVTAGNRAYHPFRVFTAGVRSDSSQAGK